jgi:hypothetical protein
MKMHAANNVSIKILEAVILCKSGKGTRGETYETPQIVYATYNTDKVFLSREAFASLGMITSNIPTNGEACNINNGIIETISESVSSPSTQDDKIYHVDSTTTLHTDNDQCKCPNHLHHQFCCFQQMKPKWLS